MNNLLKYASVFESLATFYNKSLDKDQADFILSNFNKLSSKTYGSLEDMKSDLIDSMPPGIIIDLDINDDAGKRKFDIGYLSGQSLRPIAQAGIIWRKINDNYSVIAHLLKDGKRITDSSLFELSKAKPKYWPKHNDSFISNPDRFKED